jgi:hypothetical protein
MATQVSVSTKRTQKLRDLIAKAQSDGSDAADMVLRLTLGDASELRRDRSVELHEIKFDQGVMRFLGVRIVEGGITVSRLDIEPS